MKTRFSPSPTGDLHLGNIRTAIFSYLSAHNQGGKFVYRIEDTDQERSKQVYIENISADLKWLGLHWDEGPGIGGTEYRQSMRTKLYQEQIQKLLDTGHAYPCFCTEQRLDELRAQQKKESKPPRYDRACLHLDPEEVKNKLAAGTSHVIRFRLPDDATMTITDALKGEVEFKTGHMADFIIQRSSGMQNFVFTNLVDDALMGITHVIRGEDHLSNAPKQAMIGEALGFQPMTYCHLPLIVTEEGKPLSKRLGSHSLHQLREQGFLPIAILNHVSRLGHKFVSDDLLEVREMVEAFSFASLSKSAAVFDEKQLHHWQKQAITKLKDDAFWTWVGPSLMDMVPESSRDMFVGIMKENFTLPSEIKKWANICFQSEGLWADGKELSQQETELLQLMHEETQQQPDIKQAIASVATKAEVKKGIVFKLTRYALTGQAHGPELQPLLNIIGLEQFQQRLKQLHEIHT